MKTLTLSLLLVCFVQFGFTQNVFEKEKDKLVINFDQSTMKKYVYQTDNNYVVEENYTNYHVAINSEKTLIVKVLNVTKTAKITGKALSAQDFKHINKDIVHRVNTGEMPLYINIPNASENQMFEADYVILRTMNAGKMTYFAPPHFSFEYQLSGDYYPGQTVVGDDYVREYAMQFFFHGQTEVAGIKNNVLLKIYNDACAKRPYAVTTPRSPQGQNNIYKELKSSQTGEKLYRSCLHPIQSEYLEGIGLYKEFYEEDGQTYTSKLISIDGVPIQQYLKLNAQNIKWANEEKAQNALSEVEPIRTEIPNEYFGGETVFGLTQKGVKDSKIQPLIQEFVKPSMDKLEAPHLIKTGIIHTVEKGETLYRLAKQYNTTVEQLKDLNELDNNTIIVNQELLIRVAD